MKKTDIDMRPEYKRSDFSKLERGKFFAEMAKGSSDAILNPATGRVFDVEEANQTLDGSPKTGIFQKRIVGHFIRRYRSQR